MSDEYFDGKQIRVLCCVTCGETTVARFPMKEGTRRLRTFDGKTLCNRCRGNQLMEQMIEKLDRQWAFWTSKRKIESPSDQPFYPVSEVTRAELDAEAAKKKKAAPTYPSPDDVVCPLCGMPPHGNGKTSRRHYEQEREKRQAR